VKQLVRPENRDVKAGRSVNKVKPVRRISAFPTVTLACAALALCAATPAQAAQKPNQHPGVAHSASQPGAKPSKQWIQQNSFQWGISRTVPQAGRGDRTGKVSVGDISVHNPAATACRHCPNLIVPPKK
jgi:hypothetical protein